MTSNRPYRDALPHERARQELIQFAGTQFDPAVVEAFCSIPQERWQEVRRETLERGERASFTVASVTSLAVARAEQEQRASALEVIEVEDGEAENTDSD